MAAATIGSAAEGTRTIAAALTAARAAGRSLPAFPGDVPGTLAAAYGVQEAAIALMPDEIIGWKVAMIPPELRERFGAERVCGPIFRRGLFDVSAGGEAVFPVIPGGFAAVEAEFVLEIGSQIPADASASDSDLLRHIRGVRAGVEIAGGPVLALNALGSAAVVSDFGGNAGLILGPSIDGRGDVTRLKSETFVNGTSVGTGDGARVPGGPLAALRFLIAQLASRSRRLRTGDFVSTGATTGIHPVEAGARIEARFDEAISIRGRAVAPAGS